MNADNHRLKILLMLLLLLVIASPAFGRIGETVKQIEDRYGPPSFSVPGKFPLDELGNEIRVYSFHGFTVTVTFMNERGAVELFVKYKDQIPADHWEKMTEAEIDAILAAYESAGVKWKPEEISPLLKGRRPLAWTSENGRLKAINMFNELQIAAVDYLEKRMAKIKEKEAARLEGF